MCSEKSDKRSVKNSVYRGTQKHSNTVWPMDGISYKWILVYFDCTKYNEINIHFCHGEKHVNYKIGNE